ncbi:protein phosphatase [Salinivibrio sp. MA351]|jgi:Chemotaxis protein|uniref:Protein phosphatase CheZ n=1 Tax=Salinivibrio costicola subsp. alcaliphilus TaxID=272773 RepID=A0ABX3KV07_SALCS|nr:MULTISPECIES: protein phosphatase CheZ [Salinivibrio]NUY56303.1 protein phosphatase CheZ [Salinivibrio sp. EAGSL]OOE93276.1 protein phosphatase [Salinivibrio sp. AR647]OOE93578.1 protein phosphatase [Salinivibrio sp. AR640]OOE99121.1 protein phosphatase [Salinivibrio sp. IB643]OOF00634.1 protein phosphatase [Salinivibrio sp. MA351]
MINLDQAKQLVAYLESGEQDNANTLLTEIAKEARDPLFNEVGKLTRQLHDSITDFRLDPRVSDLANVDIPDARDRLTYVMQKTELAANKTMDAVERTMPIASDLQDNLQAVRPNWNSLMRGDIALDEFKPLCHSIEGLLTQVEGGATELHAHLTEILMAQDFQDLTGQVIRRVIELVQEVEQQLVEILTAFGMDSAAIEAASATQADDTTSKSAPEGPVIHPEERDDVVHNQDDVDDLLSSLGF